MASHHKYNCAFNTYIQSSHSYERARLYDYDRLVFHTFCVCLKFKETAQDVCGDGWLLGLQSGCFRRSHFEILRKYMFLRTGNTLRSMMIHPVMGSPK